jgi:hypothetical protein
VAAHRLPAEEPRDKTMVVAPSRGEAWLQRLSLLHGVSTAAVGPTPWLLPRSRPLAEGSLPIAMGPRSLPGQLPKMGRPTLLTARVLLGGLTMFLDCVAVPCPKSVRWLIFGIAGALPRYAAMRKLARPVRQSLVGMESRHATCVPNTRPPVALMISVDDREEAAVASRSAIFGGVGGRY